MSRGCVEGEVLVEGTADRQQERKQEQSCRCSVARR